MRDQMIMARVYATIARMKNKLDLYLELSERLKESQCALGDANTDADLGRSAPEKIKAMGQVLSKAREQLYECKLVTQKLRVMLQSADGQVRLCLKKQSTFLSQLATKTVPNGIHCLSMRLTISYYLLPPEKRKFPRSENPNLYHYALFSDNVLAASVVVNSTIMNVKVMEATFMVTVDDIECAYFDKVDGLCGFGAQNRESIAQLIWGFFGFFDYWSFRHDYANAVISVRTGSIVSKQAKDWTRRIENDRHLICIEDPFETSHDLGRVVDKHSIRILREEFERAANIMQYDPDPCVKLF